MKDYKKIQPYTDEKLEIGFLRTFKNEVNENELVWHRDHKNRKITVLEGKKWMVQFDNEIPKEMIINKSFQIPKNVYHRIYKKGYGDLKVYIEEF